MKRLAACGALNLGLAACAQMDPESGFQAYMFAVLGALIFSGPISMAIHEFGHAAMGALVGRKIYYVALGDGEQLGSLQIGETQVVFGRNLIRGYVMGFPAGPESRWRASLYILGGTLANFIAASAAVALIVALAPDAGLSLVNIAAGAGFGFAFMNVLCLGALVPRAMTIAGGKAPSDGRRLLSIWRNRDAAEDKQVWHDAFRGDRLMRACRWGEARGLYEAVLERAPEEIGFFGCLLHVMGRSQGAHAVLACWFERRDAFEAAPCPRPQLRALALGTTAWHALRTGEADHFTLADELSERAIEADPASPPVMATRGAVLVAKGERDKGLALLADGLRGVTDRVDKAEFCEFLARDAGRQGDAVKAAAFSALEQHMLAKA